jgi:hypothetical protein
VVVLSHSFSAEKRLEKKKKKKEKNKETKLMWTNSDWRIQDNSMRMWAHVIPAWSLFPILFPQRKDWKITKKKKKKKKEKKEEKIK